MCYNIYLPLQFIELNEIWVIRIRSTLCSDLFESDADPLQRLTNWTISSCKFLICNFLLYWDLSPNNKVTEISSNDTYFLCLCEHYWFKKIIYRKVESVMNLPPEARLIPPPQVGAITHHWLVPLWYSSQVGAITHYWLVLLCYSSLVGAITHHWLVPLFYSSLIGAIKAGRAYLKCEQTHT